MRACPPFRRTSLVAAVLARAEAFLLEPAEPVESAETAELAAAATAQRERPHPLVAVVGLEQRCGVTTVARALAAEMASRWEGAAAVCSADPSLPALSLPTPAATRLARALEYRASGARRAAGRLCLTDASDLAGVALEARFVAPLVVEVGHAAPPAVALSLADHVVVVASPRAEPALAAVVCASLARVGPEPLVALNRAGDPGRWSDRPALLLAESRAGARRALAGREPRGALGAGVAELADLCEGSRW